MYNIEGNSMSTSRFAYSFETSTSLFKDVNLAERGAITSTICQQAMPEYKRFILCTCNEGYELASDGCSCDDVNECLDLNGGCEFGCLNNIGSYQCHMSLWSRIRSTKLTVTLKSNVMWYNTLKMRIIAIL